MRRENQGTGKEQKNYQVDIQKEVIKRWKNRKRAQATYKIR